MDTQILINTVSRLMTPAKGILAIDESVETINKRFSNFGLSAEEEERREYREVLISAPEIEKYISGYILHDETIKQSTKDGRSFVSVLEKKGIDVGIKVDAGLIPFENSPEEKITNGILGLEERLAEYKKMGATFAKWRAVYKIGEGLPSQGCMKENALYLAKYVLLCQSLNIVPIIEPEILMEGDHDINECFNATVKNLNIVFEELLKNEVFMPGIILKINMILPGSENTEKALSDEVARLTLKCLREHVPGHIGGIVFLSGGQGDEEATSNLNEMHKIGMLPWPLSFSYSRAIQNKVLEDWVKNNKNAGSAQSILLEKARLNSLASEGKFN
jgi:fructose-bisphosphate aldolase class I